MFALIDCNNFYASCERLFRPDLRDKPIVVLSNNDGCVIARSNEAKALNIAMGAPYFKIKAFCKQYHVHVFSSNYALYGDLSQRVMNLIEDAWTDVDIYSIDEAFLNLSSMPTDLHDSFCLELQKHVLKSTGIPTSIGIGPTKTLAKIANHLCKKKLNIPVFNISNQREWLQQINIGDVWGIGEKWQKKLSDQRIYTAAELAAINPNVLRKQFNLSLQRTAMELQGFSCCNITDAASKSIVSSRSFGEMQNTLEQIAQAISGHCATACDKLRAQDLLVQQISVFIRTNRFRDDLSQYNNAVQFNLINPTDDLRLITRVAKLCLTKLFKPTFYYKKVGVCFNHLTSKSHQQLDLFNQPTNDDLQKKDQFMDILDSINRRYGRHTIKLAAEGCHKPWAGRSTMHSPSYTTKWSDLAIIKS